MALLPCNECYRKSSDQPFVDKYDRYVQKREECLPFLNTFKHRLKTNSSKRGRNVWSQEIFIGEKKGDLVFAIIHQPGLIVEDFY